MPTQKQLAYLALTELKLVQLIVLWMDLSNVLLLELLEDQFLQQQHAWMDTYVLKATSPASCVASAANCKQGTATNASPSVETCTSCVSGFVLKATSPATCVAAATAGCTVGTATNATPSVETCTECGADGYRTGAPTAGACT